MAADLSALVRRTILEMEAEKWRGALLADSARAAAEDGEAPTAEGPGLEGYFDLDRLASDEVSGSMTGAEVVGACRESAVAVMRDLVKHGNTNTQVDTPQTIQCTSRYTIPPFFGSDK